MQQRKPFRLPVWLISLLIGTGAGVAGLWYFQENHLPPRLSFDESKTLRTDLETAIAERTKLGEELKQTNQRLASAQSTEAKAKADRAEAVQTATRLQKNLAQFVTALPPDPRGGPIGIRAASFSQAPDGLSYNIIFTRTAKTSDQFRGAMQLVVTGLRPGGREETLILPAVTMALDTYEQLQGNLPITSSMQVKQVSIRVLTGPGGNQLATRVFRL
jgi:hypothetical protein